MLEDTSLCAVDKKKYQDYPEYECIPLCSLCHSLLYLCYKYLLSYTKLFFMKIVKMYSKTERERRKQVVVLATTCLDADILMTVFLQDMIIYCPQAQWYR